MASNVGFTPTLLAASQGVRIVELFVWPYRFPRIISLVGLVNRRCNNGSLVCVAVLFISGLPSILTSSFAGLEGGAADADIGDDDDDDDALEDCKNNVVGSAPHWQWYRRLNSV